MCCVCVCESKGRKRCRSCFISAGVCITVRISRRERVCEACHSTCQTGVFAYTTQGLSFWCNRIKPHRQREYIGALLCVCVCACDLLGSLVYNGLRFFAANRANGGIGTASQQSEARCISCGLPLRCFSCWPRLARTRSMPRRSCSTTSTATVTLSSSMR